MSKGLSLVLKILVSVVALVLAALRFTDPSGSKEWLDTTFLLLLVVPLFAFLIPWHRLTGLKALGVEFSLDSPSVRGAIEGIEMSGGDARSIRRTLYDLRSAVDDARGSRILWIDDHPQQILGERRILRALGIEVVSSNGTDSARRILAEDNDFDLAISDMQRKSEPGSAFSRYGGIEYIQELRQSKSDPIVSNLPVVFYTAYRPEQVELILEQVSAKNLADVHFCHSVEGLLKEVFAILPAARAEALRVRSRKPATDIR